MADLKFYKEPALPATPEADAFYFIQATGPNGGAFAESYVTDSTGTPRMIGNSLMIQEVANALSNLKLERTADIASRDALALTATDRALYLVTDASADPTVDGGAATYFWDGTTWTKVSEFESLDVVTNWADVVGRPNSSPAAIDQAVADSHTHPNLAVLDAITDAGSGAIITTPERNQIGTNQSGILALQADAHTHPNKTELDKIGEDASGCMTYNGQYPMAWTSKNW
ncbi:MAG: hypothetical protein AAF599_09680 [Bacteroidota bacterium]